MRGVVTIEEPGVLHIIPRNELRYAEIVDLGGDGWALKYQLAGVAVVRSVEWKGESRPASLKDKITIGLYNQIAAQGVLTILTRGYRDVHLERRADKVFLVRSGLVEDDAQVVLCRKFITSTTFALLSSTDVTAERRHELLEQILSASRNLLLPEGFAMEAPE